MDYANDNRTTDEPTAHGSPNFSTDAVGYKRKRLIRPNKGLQSSLDEKLDG